MKNKSVRRMALFLIVAISAVFCASCSGKAGASGSSSGVDSSAPVVQTGTCLVENGTSEYRIVIPENPVSCEQFAASELNYFLNLSAGVQLETITDAEAAGREGKYISLGATSLREEILPDFDESILGYSGFEIRTEGETVFISGANDSRSYGTAYGVYDFLSKTIGLEIYADDEFDYREYGKGNSVVLYDLDYVSVPDIQLMGLGSATLTQDRTYMRRMRLTSFYSGDYCMGGVHSTGGYFMSPANYPDHPEWFWTSQGLTGICWSDDGVVEALAQEIIEKTQSSEVRYVFVTQPDTETYGCTCGACRENLEKYGTPSGLQLYFINRVADKVREYYEAADPGKDLTLVVFAYRFTLEAPSAETMETYYEDLNPHDNVAVSFIPIGMDFQVPITAPENSSFYESMLEWSEIFHRQKLIIYTYGVCFHCFFDVFNDFGSIQGSLKAYSGLGVELINEQDNMESVMGCFEQLRIYLKSKLAWDTDRDTDALISDFFEHYYKSAAGAMEEYFNAVTAYTSAVFRERNLSTGIYVTLYDKIDYGALLSLRGMLDRAEEEIAYLRRSDPDLYKTLLDRIKREKLTVWFSLLASHASKMDEADYQEVKREFSEYCAKFNIVRWRENITLESFLDGLA